METSSIAYIVLLLITLAIIVAAILLRDPPRIYKG